MHDLRTIEGILPIQARMARAGLAMTIRQLAQRTGLDKATIVRFEMGQTVRRDTVNRIQSALEGAGARFFNGHDDDRAGVDVPVPNQRSGHEAGYSDGH